MSIAFKMRAAVLFSKASKAMSRRNFATAASESATSNLKTTILSMINSGATKLSEFPQTSSGALAVMSAIFWLGYSTHKVDAKLSEIDGRLSANMAGLKEVVASEVAGVKEVVSKEVDAKMAGVKEVVSKEVDAKVAGIEKGVDAKVAGIEKGVDAKVAGIADKAKVEALIVLKDYGVSR